MSGNKFELVMSGNSQVYSYGSGVSKVALKVVPHRSSQASHLRNEWNMLRSLRHENIVQPLKYQEDINFNGKKSSSQLRLARNVLVLEWAHNGSLLKYLQAHSLSVPQVRAYFHTICLTVSHLHNLHIAHRDLKLENVLVFQKGATTTVKLTDFGFATFCDKEGEIVSVSGHKGTRRGYMAPEIHACLKQPNNQYDAFKADVFALGVSLFTLLFKQAPFNYAISEDRLFSLLMAGRTEEFWANHKESQVAVEQNSMLQDFKSIFLRTVSFDPSARPTVAELLDCEWLKGKKQLDIL